MELTTLLSNFGVGLGAGFVVFLFYYTEFFTEYAKLFRVGSLLKAVEYEEWKKTNNFGYPVFIREKYSNFLSRLFGCPICLGTFICFGFYLTMFGLGVFKSYSYLLDRVGLVNTILMLDSTIKYIVINFVLSIFYSLTSSAFACITFFKLDKMYKEIN